MYFIRLLCVSILAFSFILPAFAALENAAAHPITESFLSRAPVQAKNGMVASQSAEASRVGLEILKNGGNAIDAAVAMGFAMAVTLPRAGNLGGGGFMMLHHAYSDQTMAIDYRETAPEDAYEDMFLDELREVDTEASRYSYNSAGVPGTIKGMELALNLYGTLTWEEVLAPAIRLAEEGFIVDAALAASLEKSKKHLNRSAAVRKVFFQKNGEPYKEGQLLIQADLAWSLKQLSEFGSDAFYQGELGKRFVQAIRKGGGLMKEEDLSSYEAYMREPVEGMYRGYRISSMPLPSSGGVHLIQMLNTLEGYPLGEYGHNSVESVHVGVETMKRAYADRSKYLGDPSYVSVPVEQITSRLYAQRLRKSISEQSTTPSQLILPGKHMPKEGRNTTHYSVMDRQGNVVSNTYTLNFAYGSGLIAEGTGILLNNEMDDFSAKPGVPNAYGLIGGDANKIEGGKRPLSSMTPTIIFKDDKPYMAVGSPGGSHIITTVLQVISNVIDYDMNISEATSAPRYHHQWLPDLVRIERGFRHDTLDALLEKGHDIEVSVPMGGAQNILYKDQTFYGATDPRKAGSLAIGF